MALRLPIKSTADLASIFNRQLRNTSVLSLEPGIIQGHVDVIALKSIKIFRVKLNLSVAICADRSPGKTLFSIDLLPANISNCLVAQGVSFQRPALFGFNNNLRDVDLVLPACSNMCVIAVPNHFLAKQLDGFGCFDSFDILDKFNAVTSSSVSSDLLPALKRVWSDATSTPDDFVELEIMSLLIQCLTDKNERKVARSLTRTRNGRNDVARSVLSLIFAEPTKPLKIQDLSCLLHQSRTSIFSSCKEKFGMAPVQLIRSVRLHQVHHALLDVEFSEQHNLHGVTEIAEFFGFVGRSHFAKYYKNEFLETPSQTLARRTKAERIF